jgi:MFS family permease
MPNRISLGLLPRPDFRRLWIAQTVSNAGSGVSTVAIPLTAVLLLTATPADMGVLGAASTTPALLLSLFVGVWVDRLPRRRLLIGADLGRALLLGLIPLAAALGMLRLEILDAVAFAAGTLTVVFDIAVTSYVPALVSREELVAANGQLQLGGAAAVVAGPGVAGWLVQIVGAPFAVVADALSFLASAALLGRIATTEPAATPAGGDRHSVWREIGEGLRAVWDDAILRPMVLSTAIGSFGGGILQAVYVLYVTRELGIAPSALGLILASGGVASMLGAGVAGTLARRVGPGVALTLGQLVVALGAAVVPLAGARPELALPLLVLGRVLFSGGLTIFSINQISLRQAITPPGLLGRVNATRRFVVFGIIPIGALISGLLGTTLGLTATLVVSVTIEALSFLTAATSPLRTARVEPSAA